MIIFAISQFIGFLIFFDFLGPPCSLLLRLGLLCLGLLLSIIIGGITVLAGLVMIITAGGSSQGAMTPSQYQPPVIKETTKEVLVRYCPHCGSQALGVEQKFCMNCGGKLS